MNLFDAPEYSPWGAVQHFQVLCPGAFQVSTASHGGVMIDCEIMDMTLSRAAQKCGFQECGYLCFEEDCAASVALRELMDKKLFAAPVNEHFKPGEYSEIIDRSIQRYYPEYWASRERSQRKSSVKDKLTAKPVSGSPPARKSRVQDER